MNPGEGAIEYARTLTVGLTREQSAPIIRNLLADSPADPRVKRCVCCGYPFRDKTRPGNAKVCGGSCTLDKNARNRRIKRGEKSIRVPVDYVFWLEYPYYVSERAMLSKTSRERSYSPDKLATIIAARQTAGKI
jgi:hypothetical protein